MENALARGVRSSTLIIGVMLAASCGETGRTAQEVPVSNARTSPTVARASSLVGPFAIGPDSFSVVLDSSVRNAAKSIDALRILDARGRLVFAESLLTSLQSAEEFADASAFLLTNARHVPVGVFLTYGLFPSAPGTGEGFRILARQEGRLRAITPRVSTGGLPWLLAAGADSSIKSLLPGDQLVMKEWLGHFAAIVSLRVDLRCAAYAAACLHPVLHDSIAGLARFPVEAEFQPISERALVSVFDRPGASSHVDVEVVPGDTVVAVEGAGAVELRRGREWGLVILEEWLCVRLRGRVGWIRGDRDLTGVGLPQAG